MQSIKMTKKKITPVRKYEPVKFKVEETLLKCQPKSMPANLTEEKEKFLRSGKPPQFEVKDRAKLDELASKTRNRIRFELFGEAKYILDKVYDLYGNGEYFLEHAFGICITKEEATPILLKYIAENSLMESMKIHWCDNLACSAKLVWTGPVLNANRPDLRKYSLWINGSQENNYMRECGIRCLMDHEIGTHFFRSYNDGLQPWFSERERFGLRKMGTFEGQCTEEGLAAINTVLRGRVKYLWGAALAYYTACKATEMTFKQLFDHLGHYISNREYRWKQAMRVKRGLADPNDLGGFGNDQCYFEGAVNILRNMEKIDFYLLMMGKVCYDELDRIKRVARKDVVRFPLFMKNMNAYRRTLSRMVLLNCLNGLHPRRGPPDVYIKRLEERKNGKKGQKARKVRASSKLSSLGKKIANIQKASLKKGAVDTADDNNNEVESFKCQEPFINFHLRKKNNPPAKDILETSIDTVSSVTQISNNITTKDTSLEKQIQKLQGIVHGHSWTCRDEEYKQSLITEAKKELNGSACCEISGTFSQMSFQDGNETACGNVVAVDRSSSISSLGQCVEHETHLPSMNVEKNNTHTFELSMDGYEIQQVDAKVHHDIGKQLMDGEKSTDRQSAFDHCSRDSSHIDAVMSRSSTGISSIEDKNCNKEASSSTEDILTAVELCNDPLSAQDNSFVSENKNGLLQRRKSNHRHSGRKSLHTPVAELTTNKSLQTDHRYRRPVETLSKRVSLRSSSQRALSQDVIVENQYRNNSALSLSQMSPSSVEDENSFVGDIHKTNELSASKISVDVLTDSQDFLPRALGLKYLRQGSTKSNLSVSSEIDFKSFLCIKHPLFPSKGSKRKIPISSRSPMRSLEFVTERSQSNIVRTHSKSGSLYDSEVSDMESSIDRENFYQPLIISSAKPLVQKDVSRNRYPCV